MVVVVEIVDLDLERAVVVIVKVVVAVVGLSRRRGCRG